MGSRRKALALAVASLLAGKSLCAATLSWDPDGAGPNVGGTGAWNTSSAFWTANGVNFVTWSNANPDNAIFDGTAGVVSLGANITAGTLRFNTDGYTIDLSAGSFATNGSISLAAGVNAYTITSSLSSRPYTAICFTNNSTTGVLKL